MTDQEQTERGASTVDALNVIEAYARASVVTAEQRDEVMAAIRRHRADLDGQRRRAHLAEHERDQLRAVTAESESHENVKETLRMQLAQVTAERDAMREVVETGREYGYNEHIPGCRHEYRHCTCGYDDFKAALARLDATRKAEAN